MRVVDAAHAAHVDQLHVIALQHHVVGFEVAVDQPRIVQIREGGQNPVNVGNGFGGRKRAAFLTELLQRFAANILHHDEAFIRMLDEVVDADDIRVFDRGEELPLCHCGRGARRVVYVQQTFQNHIARQGLIESQIDPAEAAVRKRTLHLVLRGNHIAGFEARNK